MTATNEKMNGYSEVNDNERGDIAYERILLQSVIAYMFWIEPRFFVQFQNRFLGPMAQILRNDDGKAVDDRGNDVIRSILRIMDRATPGAQDDAQSRPTGQGGGKMGLQIAAVAETNSIDRVEIIEHPNTWELRVDGVFWGDYFDKDSAGVAAKLVRKSLY